MLAQRSSVCQDFAHLILACLRGHGLPPRYGGGEQQLDVTVSVIPEREDIPAAP